MSNVIMENLKPWETEVDYSEWVDTETKYSCVIKRSATTGALCGYVGLPEGHVFYKGPHWGRLCSAIYAHGGITFIGSNICRPSGEALTGRYIGFDCAHDGDLCPKRDELNGIYRDYAFVKHEVESVARQLAKFK
jgi:hypothetical protein